MTGRWTTRRLVGWGLAICIAIAAGLALLASGSPDGLEHVAQTLGFESSAGQHATGSGPLADYAVRGLGDSALSRSLAGLVGVLVVAAFAFGLMRMLRRPSGRP